MAAYVRIGPTTDLYDLTDRTTAGHLYIRTGGVRSTQQTRDGYWIEIYELAAFSSTHSQIINYVEDITDHLENGAKYIADRVRSTPIWLYEYADSETAKRALVRGGKLEAITEQDATRLMERNVAYYILEIERGPWEKTSEVTEVNASTMDGVTNTVALETIYGDKPGRISQFLVRGTATNTESTPLTKLWAGIREKNDGYASFDPVLNLEYAQSTNLFNETALASVADSNTYPSGSSTNNTLLVSFADTVYESRVRISLLDAFSENNLITNSGAETGDLTGWTETDAGWTADSDHESSGGYGFYMDCVNNSASMYQTVAVTAGQNYQYSYDYQIYTSTPGALSFYFLVSIEFLDSGSTPIAGTYSYRLFSLVNGGFDTITGILTAPVGAAYAKTTFTVEAGGAGAELEIAFDNYEFSTIPFDDYAGTYSVLLRAKLSAAGDVDVEGAHGYAGDTTFTPMGSGPQSLTSTSWQLIDLGQCVLPPGRTLSDVENAWKMSNLSFEIFAQRVTGTPNLYMDALLLVPAGHQLPVNGCAICRSSYTIDSGESEYAYADLDARMMEDDLPEIVAYSANFTGINTGFTATPRGWEMPNEDSILVCFAQRAASHQIADDYVVTLKYVPRYDVHNTD